VPGGLEVMLQQIGDVRAVFDDEDARHGEILS
jgi:hypothetical protein